MKSYLNLIVIMLVLTASLYLGWRVTQPELTGHWHVHPAFHTEPNGMQGIYHFNIDADGAVRVNEALPGEYIIPGYVDKVKQKIHFGGECWYVGADYRVVGNRMEIWEADERSGGWRAVAHLSKPGDCDPEQDYFIDLPISITLPRDTMEDYPVFAVTHQHLTFQVGRDHFNGEIKALAAGWWEIRGEEEIRDYFHRHFIKLPSFKKDIPAVAIIYKDASITPDELRAALTDDLQTVTKLDGYYLAHRNPNEEGLALTFRWVAF